MQPVTAGTLQPAQHCLPRPWQHHPSTQPATLSQQAHPLSHTKSNQRRGPTCWSSWCAAGVSACSAWQHHLWPGTPPSRAAAVASRTRSGPTLHAALRGAPTGPPPAAAAACASMARLRCWPCCFCACLRSAADAAEAHAAAAAAPSAGAARSAAAPAALATPAASAACVHAAGGRCRCCTAPSSVMARSASVNVALSSGCEAPQKLAQNC